jgi:hypothetical protein
MTLHEWPPHRAALSLKIYTSSSRQARPFFLNGPIALTVPPNWSHSPQILWISLLIRTAF